MTTAFAQDANTPWDVGCFDLQRPLSVNIRPILESVAGLLTDAEIDDWIAGLYQSNEGRGFDLELTAEGELVINPMVNRDGSNAEGELFVDLKIWAREYGGEAHGSNANMRWPDGSRIRPDVSWLSPEQVSQMPPISAGGAIAVAPAFVAEIISSTDTLPPPRLKMERYIANGTRLGWLIDPYRRQVYVYRPDAEPELLDDPETVSGEEVLAGFVFEMRRRIFDIR